MYQRFHKGDILGRLEEVKNELRQSRELTKIEIASSALNIWLNLSRNTSARGYFSSNAISKEDRNIEEGVALLVKREK